MQGLIARKIGMTRIFTEAGEQIPVTVMEAGPCVVVQRKKKAVDGYDAVQLGFDEVRDSRSDKPRIGHCKKAGAKAQRHLREFRVAEDNPLATGEQVTVASMEGVKHVDVTATTKGRGFQGVMRRHNMRGGPMGHGGHSKRRPGSIGQSATPSRVHKGKRMPGHMGHTQITAQNIEIIAIRAEENVLLLRGAVPGPVNGISFIKPAVKKPVAKKAAKV